jgi:integrase
MTSMSRFQDRYLGGVGPKTSFLCRQSLAPGTLKLYDKGLAQFIDWLWVHWGGIPTSIADLDVALCDFVHYLYLLKKGKCRSYAQAAMSAVCHAVPEAKGHMFFTSQALRGWKKLVPPKSHPPLTWKVTLVIAFVLTSQGDFTYAIGVLLAFEGYLRIGELCNLRISDVLLPGDQSMGVVIDTAQLLLRVTKTGPNKWATIKDPFVLALLVWLQRTRKFAGQTYLFNFNEGQFRRRFKKVCKLLHLSGGFVPHSLRHGKATHDFLSGVPLETILILGRWAAHKSARLYVQTGRAQLLAGYTPVWIAELAQLLSTDLSTFFAQAHHALAGAL